MSIAGENLSLFRHFQMDTAREYGFLTDEIEYKVCSTGFNAKDLLSKAPLIVSGHFHLRDERKYDQGRILYLGNPYQMDFGDVGSIKGYYILDIPTSTYEFTENLLYMT